MKKTLIIIFLYLLFFSNCSLDSKNEYLYPVKIKKGVYQIILFENNIYPYFYTQPYSAGYSESFTSIDSSFAEKATIITFKNDTTLFYEKYILSNQKEYLSVKYNDNFAWLQYKIPLPEVQIDFLKTFLCSEKQISTYPEKAWLMLIEPFVEPDKLFIKTANQRIFIVNKKTKKFKDFGSGRLEGCCMKSNKKYVKCSIDLMWNTSIIDADGNEKIK